MHQQEIRLNRGLRRYVIEAAPVNKWNFKQVIFIPAVAEHL